MSYHRPTDLAHALEIASQPARTILAGGTDYFPAKRQGQQAETVLDVTAISELKSLTKGPEAIRFGAALRWSDIIRADLPAAFDTLKQAGRQVGSVQIQNAATMAGNLCNASPAADGVPPLLALDAQVELASAARGLRTLPLSDFLKGVRQTALEPDELLTAIIVPTPPAGAGSSFEKLGSRDYLVISIAMVAAIIRQNADGRIDDARIAVGSCSAVAQRLRVLEADCLGKHPDQVAIKPDQLSELTPIYDVRGSAAYRLDAVAELCGRAIRKACGDE